MMVLSNSANQTLQPGESIIFDTTVLKTNACACHRRNSSSVKLCHKGCYTVSFSGNISGTSTDTSITLIVTAGGEPLPETLMVATPSIANASNNVATKTGICNCCGDYSRIGVRNNGPLPLTVLANSSLVLEEVHDA